MILKSNQNHCGKWDLKSGENRLEIIDLKSKSKSLYMPRIQIFGAQNEEQCSQKSKGIVLEKYFSFCDKI